MNKTQSFWGEELQLDLVSCDPDLIRSEDVIRGFVDNLCNLIEMRKYGECHVVRFGDDPKVTGYSMFQMIETSNISGHFAEDTNNAYLNVFSCKEFDWKLVRDFAKAYFKARTARVSINYRK